MTLEDIGKEIGFTRERARQIEMKASKKINWFLHSKDMEISVAIRRLFIRKRLLC
jgi:DNA-directed RNA polymerase sigma subunit (sigma70/sigma32)